MTRVLILGGTRHVGRAAVEHALALGWDVTAVNRGLGAPMPAGVRALRADRLAAGSLAEALSSAGDFDLVLDTWSAAPRIVRESAALLADRAGMYAYVSSASVYEWPWAPGFDEASPLVRADAGADQTDYAEDKRGAELAVLESFGEERCLLARAGLILGPYEVVGRLPWWFDRISRGGDVLAPGPRDRAIQYIDGRDLTAWLLEAGAGGVRGALNTVGPPGLTTMGALLDLVVEVSDSSARLVWLTPQEIADAGIAPWTELPIWAPPDGEDAAIHDIGVQRALDLGLVCRPTRETVGDTWAWLQAEGYPESVFSGRVGISADREQQVLSSLR